MELSIVTPERHVLTDEARKITADGRDGSFCLLPNHIDYATSLAVGVTSYVDPEDEEHFVAIDRGLLVKRGSCVRIATRRAIGRKPLDELEDAVRTTFRERSQEEMEARLASSKLQASFVQRFLDIGEPAL